MSQVEKWYRDYLKALYDHIKIQLGQQLSRGKWDDSRIVFSFSLPTTWTDKSIVERFRSLIKQAGYGEHANHTVELGLTEAEAAAVHVSKEAPDFFSKGDIALVCDAGGGTTDISILNIEQVVEEHISMRQLDVVAGRAIGSVAIDSDFADMVYEKLTNANNRKSLGFSDEDIDRIAWNVSHTDEYQYFKCAFGQADTEDMHTFSCSIKQLPHNYVDTESRISNGTMRFDRGEFQSLFDKQIQKLFAHIDAQIERTKRLMPQAKITQLVLSGGLGNSAYVQQRLRTRYEHGGDCGFSNVSTMRVKVAPDPQLAVCKGLVEDTLQKLVLGRSAISWRCCRESYGVRCCLPKSEENMRRAGSRQAILDELDGRHYYPNAIHWMIKQGEPVSSAQPMKAEFWKVLKPGDQNRTWESAILVSREEGRSLPHFADSANVKELCRITSCLENISEKDFEEKRKGKFGFGAKNKYFLVQYEIRAVIGPADLCFELWFKGKKMSSGNAIKVQWMPAQEPTSEPPHSVNQELLTEGRYIS